MRSPRRLLLLLAASTTVLIAASPALAQAQVTPSDPWAQATSDIPADSNVRFGVLPNGMQYAVLRNATPAGQASLRLRIDAGSLMENEDQLGLAHFMEHMAFNGTTNIPENELLHILERLGLAFGADTNAFTGFDQTAYLLELPRTNDETVDAALRIMREQVSEALMAADAVDAERGVIEGEERMRNTPQLRVAKAQFGLLASGQRLANRLPIGDLNIIRTAPRDRFVDFYNAYYRPNRATFIAVGDFDVDVMEAKIRAAFEGWTPKAADGPDPDLGQVAQRGPETRILVEPGVESSVDINWIRPPDLEPDTVAERRENLIRNLGLAVLTRRLGELARADNPPFISANASNASVYDSLSAGSVSANFNPGGLTRALQTIEQEQRRLIQFGITQAELQREITDTRTRLQNAVTAAATRSTPALANGLLSAVNDRNVFASPATSLELFNATVEGLTPDQVTAAVRPVFEGQGPVLMVTSPVAIEGGEAAVTAALEASRQVAVTARADEAALEWPYTDFGTPARPGARTEIADLGVTRVDFPNGVRLFVKPTDFRDNQILVNVRTGIGELGLPTDRITSMTFANSVMGPGGTSKLTVDQLTRVLSGKTYNVSAGMDTDAYTLSGSTKPEDLQLQMQVLTAYLVDPGLRAAPFERARSQFPAQLAQLRATPGGVLGRELGELISSGDQRDALPTEEQIAAMTIEEIRAGVTNGRARGPIDVVMVGDVTVDDAIATVANTFGALPARGAQAEPLPGSAVRRFPAPTAEPIQLKHEGPGEQAIGVIGWPTADAIGDKQEARQLAILSAVIQLRLNEEVREKLGISYGPGSAASSSSVFPDYGYMLMLAETRPESLPVLFTAFDSIAASLRDTPISDDELLRARAPAVESVRRSQADNGYWVGQLAEAGRKPETFDEIRSNVSDLESVTPADIQRLARQYLTPDKAWRLTVTSDNPAAPPAAAPAPAAQ
ncbi:pitrilysin family protein [Brevundimonas sp. Root1423]|uniref:M16 family metallopeptidase n=1 Tax=Brevundimonas sp. Root1423 TaxID=1736462 RepID=UPI0007021191|nr:M16 family metallopeptidase [Brevundimonas sp. Root1423]KQY84611.1 peptidase M16 [Brevundimonas sp. Root1423]